MNLTQTRPNVRHVRRQAATHLYSVGQTVRLKGGFGMSPNAADVFHITARLPAKGDALQYRIRNDDERHERVTTQDSLEPVGALQESKSATLIERTFGHGQGTKA